MAAVAARPALAEQMRRGQLLQQPARVARRGPGEGRRRLGRHLRAGSQSHQAKQPLRRSFQRPVGHVESAPYTGAFVAVNLKGVKAIPRPKRGDILRDRWYGSVCQVDGGKVNSQRQVVAGPRQVVHRLRFAFGAVPAKDAAQQRTGLGRAQRLNRKPLRPIDSDQAGEPLAAGHHHQTVAARRQQRANLLRIGRIIKQDKDSAVGKQGSVPPGCCLEIFLSGYAESPQQIRKRLKRRDR